MSKVRRTVMTVRGKRIDEDEDGLINLNSLWEAAGFSKNRKPAKWRQSATTTPLITATYERVVGLSDSSKIQISKVIRTKAGGTYAHPILALAYAKYLSPKLAVEVNEVFLRYKAADPTLADDILERGTAEANEWAGRRALSRRVRNSYTDTLRDHGVDGRGYGACTNATYQGLFGLTAARLRQDKGLSKKANLRDAMSMKELAFTMAAEALSTERIEDENAHGSKECRQATLRSATAIRGAIETDRKDRQKRLSEDT